MAGGVEALREAFWPRTARVAILGGLAGGHRNSQIGPSRSNVSAFFGGSRYDPSCGFLPFFAPRQNCGARQDDSQALAPQLNFARFGCCCEDIDAIPTGVFEDNEGEANIYTK